MIITKTQQEAMLEAAKPLMQWIAETCHPHCVAHVEHNNIELLEGVAQSRIDESQSS